MKDPEGGPRLSSLKGGMRDDPGRARQGNQVRQVLAGALSCAHPGRYSWRLTREAAHIMNVLNQVRNFQLCAQVDRMQVERFVLGFRCVTKKKKPNRENLISEAPAAKHVKMVVT